MLERLAVVCMVVMCLLASIVAGTWLKERYYPAVQTVYHQCA